MSWGTGTVQHWAMATGLCAAVAGCGRLSFEELEGTGVVSHTDSSWTRVVVFDAESDPCPGEWTTPTQSPPVTCSRWTYDGQPPVKPSFSASFPSPLESYTEVRGLVAGYQYGSTDGFSPGGESIDEVFVDGITISHGTPRTHLWTYAAALSEDLSGGGVCPCKGGSKPPAWVGSHYYCESANTGMWEYGQWYADDPLWDRDSTDGSCNAPFDGAWFERPLDQPSNAPIEVRIMANHNTNDEDIGIARLELYVR